MSTFTIRVYGILKDQQNRILVSDEYIRGRFFTKFPGGGLEFGEGTRDCVKREFKEETGLTIDVGAHFYTTDYFQISGFNNKDQIISIYYWVHALENDLAQLNTSNIPFDFTAEQLANKEAQYERLRWIALSSLSSDDVHLPIDKIVVNMLTNATNNAI